jgi:acrylyl-CoA reductase (NADPH)
LTIGALGNRFNISAVQTVQRRYAVHVPVTFKALVVTEKEENQFVRAIEEKKVSSLPPGEVLVRVLYSSLNYKDVLSATGNRGVTRGYPHTPGIDASGIVVESEDEKFKVGDAVIVTSYDLGMNTPGGFGQFIRVPSTWVVPLPAGLSTKEAMIYGTAGFTAGLSVWQLISSGITPEQGDIVVSGATGGVGCIAVSILSKLGYHVTAVNGSEDKSDFLKMVGAKEIISKTEACDKSNRPLLKAKWAGGIDVVGGDILATMIRSAKPGAVITACGNVGSPELPLTVYPFILRGIKLIGIDSQNCPMSLRARIWEKLSSEWKIEFLSSITTEASLDDLGQCIERMLNKKHTGRTLIKISEE